VVQRLTVIIQDCVEEHLVQFVCGSHGCWCRAVYNAKIRHLRPETCGMETTICGLLTFDTSGLLLLRSICEEQTNFNFTIVGRKSDCPTGQETGRSLW
jgi:hypothetical protein